MDISLESTVAYLCYFFVPHFVPHFFNLECSYVMYSVTMAFILAVLHSPLCFFGKQQLTMDVVDDLYMYN
jgi:hypothetical protein